MTDTKLTKPVREGLRFDEKALESYLQQHALIPDFQSIEKVEQFTSGQSNPTYLLRCLCRQSALNADGQLMIVLRKKPTGQLLQSAHQIEREYKVMQALARSAVAVPEVLHLCLDDTIIGTPFYLMRHISGRIFKDPALPGLNVETRKAIYASAADMLARIHDVDLDSVGLEDYGRADGFVARQLSRWTKQYQASVADAIPEMERLIEWLTVNIPADDATAKVTLVHGDYRLDNMIFHESKNEILAVLDWELSTLGNPLSDLGYFSLIYYLTPETPAIAGLKGLDLGALGIPSSEQFALSYLASRLPCHISADTMGSAQKYFVVFALFRLAAIAQGVAARARQGIASSAEAERVGRMARPCAQLALSLI
ncbi:MAG: phosphotransferase [Cyanobacteria bacterium REEB67]|nr:phosphotransferase [Cyanobacteria bacterium REEB67]